MTEVTEEDREAAWTHRPTAYDSHNYSAWMAGVYDDARIIQAFARHREASTEALQSEVEVLRAETVCPFCNGDAATFDSARTGKLCTACGDQGKVPAMAAQYLIGVRLFYDMAEAEVQALRAENARLREAHSNVVSATRYIDNPYAKEANAISHAALENRDD